MNIYIDILGHYILLVMFYYLDYCCLQHLLIIVDVGM